MHRRATDCAGPPPRVLAVVAFVAVKFAALRLSSELHAAASWRALADVCIFAGVVMLASLIGLAAARRSDAYRRYFGLIERTLYLGTVSWLVAVTVALATAPTS